MINKVIIHSILKASITPKSKIFKFYSLISLFLVNITHCLDLFLYYIVRALGPRP